MKRLILLIFLLIIFAGNCQASYNNNKFGIHLAQPNDDDLKSAAALVNSNGGQWGYVTLVIQENDRDRNRWQEIFDKMRELKLIPIIRIATNVDGDAWTRPKKDDADNWSNFLNSLNWVVKQRYIILFNEPNQSKEWGGIVDPYDYIETTKIYAEKIKAKNPDFFIMMAGLDAAAPSEMPYFEGESYFLKGIFEKISPSDFEKLFDGWASHSYPNPGFAGSPYATGRNSIRNYEWELELLKGFGINKNLPVYITETGWSANSVSRDTIANNYQIAFNNWLTDDRVKAVTPFVLNYQGEPFLGFSWRQYNSNDFYNQYDTVRSLDKVKGKPQISEKGRIDYQLPSHLLIDSDYSFTVKLSNFGQGIWDSDDNYYLRLNNLEGRIIFPKLQDIKPKETDEIEFYIKTNSQKGQRKIRINLVKDDKKIIEGKEWRVYLDPLPSLKLNLVLYLKRKADAKDYELQVFDEQEKLVYQKKNLEVKLGNSLVENIHNVIPENKYRVVILKPYYLPRQAIILFNNKDNTVSFKKLLPLDFNADGKFSLNDFSALMKNLRLLKMFLP